MNQLDPQPSPIGLTGGGAVGHDRSFHREAVSESAKYQEGADAALKTLGVQRRRS